MAGFIQYCIYLPYTLKFPSNHRREIFRLFCNLLLQVNQASTRIFSSPNLSIR